MVMSAAERRIWLHEVSAHLQDNIKNNVPKQIALILIAVEVKQLAAIYGQFCVDALIGEVIERLNHVAKHTSNHMLSHISHHPINDAQLIHWTCDEFVMKCDVVDDAQLQLYIDSINAILKRSFDYQQQSILLAPNLGWSMLPTDSCNPEEAIRQATVAKLLAKAHGNPDGYHYQSNVAFMQLYHEMIVDHDLKFAVRDHQFELLYQPKFNQTQHIVGVEALLRWHHPRLGLLSPQPFIERAEQSGAIVMIGDWVLKQVMQQMADLKQLHHYDLPVAINLSALQFEQIGFLERFTCLLQHYDIPPHLLTLEITEYSTFTPAGLGFNVVKAIQDLGVKIALDDFGVGHCNFFYFTMLNVDEIKIDRLFINNIEHDKTKQLIVKTLLDFAQRMNIETVVEGIETAEQAKIAFDLGASQLQGFYYGQPMTLTELQLSLLAHSPAPQMQFKPLAELVMS